MVRGGETRCGVGVAIHNDGCCGILSGEDSCASLRDQRIVGDYNQIRGFNHAAFADRLRLAVASEGKLTGIAAVGMGSDNKIFSILAGEFDIILAIGGIESMKHMMLSGSEITDEDD